LKFDLFRFANPELPYFASGWYWRDDIRSKELMPTKAATTPTLLLVESDVIIRFGLAEFLRACGVRVIEAASAEDAKAVLVAGPTMDVLMSDATLAGDENGFALAQWVRRYRPQMEVILTSSVVNKAQAASAFCTRDPECKLPTDAAGLANRIRAMLAERKRRTRPSSPTAATLVRRKRR
jgi:DNA-binding NtrC family response regulator